MKLRSRIHRLLIAPLLAVAVVAAACAPASSGAPTPAQSGTAASADPQAVADFYRGKTVRIIVGFSPGGGFDTYARLIARHLSEHIPGNPNVIVENQEGARSLLAANSVYNTAPKDGTVLVHFHGNQIVQQLLGNEAVEFDAQKFNWVGVPTPDTSACAVTTESGFTSLLEATGNRQLILGGEAPGASTSDIPNTLKAALGLNLNVVPGYHGTSKIRLAADQGEVMGGCWGWSSMKATWEEALQAGKVKVLAQGGRTAHADLPNVPLMRDLAQDEEARQLIDAGITLPSEFARPFALPPGVPEARVQAVQEAFMATLNDPELLAEAEKAQLDIAPVSGAATLENVRELFSLPQETKDRLEQALAG